MWCFTSTRYGAWTQGHILLRSKHVCVTNFEGVGWLQSEFRNIAMFVISDIRGGVYIEISRNVCDNIHVLTANELLRTGWFVLKGRFFLKFLFNGTVNSEVMQHE